MLLHFLHTTGNLSDVADALMYLKCRIARGYQWPAALQLFLDSHLQNLNTLSFYQLKLLR